MYKITLRRSRVSVAIRPLLGKPSRTSFLSDGIFSTFPFTTVTGDANEQHETVNFSEILLLAGIADDKKGEIEAEWNWRKIVRTTGISQNFHFTESLGVKKWTAAVERLCQILE